MLEITYVYLLPVSNVKQFEYRSGMHFKSNGRRFYPLLSSHRKNKHCLRIGKKKQILKLSKPHSIEIHVYRHKLCHQLLITILIIYDILCMCKNFQKIFESASVRLFALLSLKFLSFTKISNERKSSQNHSLNVYAFCVCVQRMGISCCLLLKLLPFPEKHFRFTIYSYFHHLFQWEGK